MTASAWAVVRRISLFTCIVVGVVVLLGQSKPSADQIPTGWTADQMKPIGYSDLGGHGGAFKIAIREVNNRWYLYMGHIWEPGLVIVDVTDPTNPQYLKFIPQPQDNNTWAIQLTLHDNLMLTGLELQGGGDRTKPFGEGVLLWDISDPVNPKQLSHWKTGLKGTHRNMYPGGKYAYLAASQPGFDGNILVTLDVSDPRNPKVAGRWWMPGQNVAAGETPDPWGTGLHGPLVIEGTMGYVGYGPYVVVLDMADPTQPKLVGRLQMSPPFKLGTTMSVHGVMKMPGKPLMFATSEAGGGGGGCTEPLNFSAMIDIKDPTKPRLMSLFPVPVPPKGAPYSSFCDNGARFGPHNINHEYHSPDVQKQGDLIYLTYFSAGLRIFDIKDPRMPKEVGWFIPPTPIKRYGPPSKSSLSTQTEEVAVDRRGNIYVNDRQWGLWILRYTGPGQSTSTAQ